MKRLTRSIMLDKPFLLEEHSRRFDSANILSKSLVVLV